MHINKLKPYIITLIYGFVMITIVIGLMIISQNILKTSSPITYITSSTIIDDVIPVINENDVKFIRPYSDNDVKIIKNFYDYNSDENNQENSLILFENTYLQNSGIDYGKENQFDINTIMQGTVVDVYQDNLLGNIIEIQHSNEIIASYQCLGNIKVKKDDYVTQGQIIATSGTCNITKDLGNHIHLEISKNGEIINPESLFDN